VLCKKIFFNEMLDAIRSRKIKFVARFANGITFKFAAMIINSTEIAK